MSAPNKKWPEAKGSQRRPALPTGRARQAKPAVAQSKKPAGTPNAGRPAAPPVYRPEAKPPAPQAKAARPPRPKTSPAAPPAYRFDEAKALRIELRSAATR